MEGIISRLDVGLVDFFILPQCKLEVVSLLLSGPVFLGIHIGWCGLLIGNLAIKDRSPFISLRDH